MKKRAFTLAEMLIVLLIVSILAAVTLPVVTKKKKTALTDLQKARVPIGVIMLYSGINTPTGWLDCNGQAVKKPKYAKLREVLGKDTVPVINNMPIGDQQAMLVQMQQTVKDGNADEETLEKLAQNTQGETIRWIIKAE